MFSMMSIKRLFRLKNYRVSEICCCQRSFFSELSGNSGWLYLHPLQARPGDSLSLFQNLGPGGGLTRRYGRFFQVGVGQDAQETKSSFFSFSRVGSWIQHLTSGGRDDTSQENKEDGGKEAVKEVVVNGHTAINQHLTSGGRDDTSQENKEDGGTEAVKEVVVNGHTAINHVPGFDSEADVQICDILNGRGWEPDTVSALKELNVKLSPELVSKVLSHQADLNVALSFYKWAEEQEGYQHDLSTAQILINMFSNTTDDLQMLLDDLKDTWKMPTGAFSKLLQKYCQSGKLKEAVELFEHPACQPDKDSCGHLIKALLEYGNYEKALHIFQETRGQGLMLSTRTVQKLMETFCKSGRIGEAVTVFQEMKGAGHKITSNTYESLIHGFCRARRADEAFSLFEEMKESEIPVNTTTYSILLVGLAKVGKGDAAWQLFKDMMEQGITPDVTSFGGLIESLCRSGQVLMALEVEKDFRKNGCMLPPSIYSYIFPGLCNIGHVDKALALMKELQTILSISPLKDAILEIENSNSSIKAEAFYSKTVQLLNSILFNALVNVRANYEAYKLLKEMNEAGYANNSMYSMLIFKLCKANQVDLALQLFDEMLKKGLGASDSVYYFIIHTLCKAERIDAAYKVFEESNNHGSMKLYSTLIFGLCKAGQADRAFHVLQVMQRKCLKAEAAVYGAVVSSLCRARKFDQACDIFKEVEILFPLDGSRYRGIIEGLCKAGEMRRACEIFENMRQKSLAADLQVYTSLILGYMKSGHTSEACNFFKKLKEDGLAPNIIVYNVVIAGLCKARELDQVAEILGEMSEGGCRPDNFTYCTLIDILCKLDKVDAACQVFQKMKDDGCPPDMITYFALIGGLGKSGRAEEALQFFNEMRHLLKSSSMPKGMGVYDAMSDMDTRLTEATEA